MIRAILFAALTGLALGHLILTTALNATETVAQAEALKGM